MKILAWNVQGAKKCQVREEIRDLQKSQQPDLLFIIETMVSEATTKKIYHTSVLITMTLWFRKIIQEEFGFFGIKRTSWLMSY